MSRQAASFIAHPEVGTEMKLPRFIEDEFDACPEYGILAFALLRLRCSVVRPPPVLDRPQRARRRHQPHRQADAEALPGSRHSDRSIRPASSEGTPWHAGPQLAAEKREQGGPPLQIDSDGMRVKPIDLPRDDAGQLPRTRPGLTAASEPKPAPERPG